MRNDFVQRMTETNAPLVDNLGRGYWLERPENAYLLETADPAEITRFTQALHETMTREIQVLRGSARKPAGRRHRLRLRGFLLGRQCGPPSSAMPRLP